MSNTKTTVAVPAALSDDIARLRDDHAAYMGQQLLTNRMLWKILAGAALLAKTYTPEELKAACVEAKIKTTDATSKDLMAIKLVIRPDKEDRIAQQKCSSYSKVMEQGRLAGIEPEGLADWIELGNGIEAIRRKAGEDKKAKKEAKEEADEKARQDAIEASKAVGGQITMAADADNAKLSVSEAIKVEDSTTAFKRGKDYLAKASGVAIPHEMVIGAISAEPLMGGTQVWLVQQRPDGASVIQMITNDDALITDAMTLVGRAVDKPETRGVILVGDAIVAHLAAMDELGKAD
jgi:hypothetical protein